MAVVVVQRWYVLALMWFENPMVWHLEMDIFGTAMQKYNCMRLVKKKRSAGPTAD